MTERLQTTIAISDNRYYDISSPTATFRPCGEPAVSIRRFSLFVQWFNLVNYHSKKFSWIQSPKWDVINLAEHCFQGKRVIADTEGFIAHRLIINRRSYFYCSEWLLLKLPVLFQRLTHWTTIRNVVICDVSMSVSM